MWQVRVVKSIWIRKYHWFHEINHLICCRSSMFIQASPISQKAIIILSTSEVALDLTPTNMKCTLGQACCSRQVCLPVVLNGDNMSLLRTPSINTDVCIDVPRKSSIYHVVLSAFIHPSLSYASSSMLESGSLGCSRKTLWSSSDNILENRAMQAQVCACSYNWLMCCGSGHDVGATSKRRSFRRTKEESYGPPFAYKQRFGIWDGMFEHQQPYHSLGVFFSG